LPQRAATLEHVIVTVSGMASASASADLPLPTRSGARTRVLRSAAGDAQPWELWERTPLPSLRGLVAGLWAGSSVRPVARHRTLPNGELSLMFHLGPTQRMLELGGRPCQRVLGGSFLSGLQDRPCTFETFEAHTRVAAARLLPPAGWRLLGGLPQAELTGCVLDGEAVLGGSSGVAALRERMGNASDLGGALDWLEAWLAERFTRSRPAHPAAHAARSLLHGARGQLRVDALADAAAVSPRRLRELFLREVGVPPKRLARILRFREAVERLAAAPAVDLARLALDCGYYDQAHLYRDFRALATMTPIDYLTAHGAGLDGPDVLGS
jgi:AraC-like DNA-binding protein